MIRTKLLTAGNYWKVSQLWFYSWTSSFSRIYM